MKLSVAMCTFNGAKFIKKQLESIINQQLMVDEIVVCDDGSNDETLDLVNEVAKQNPQCVWNIKQNSPSLGVTKNFEQAISLCTGDVIFLSDQDDLWKPYKTSVVIRYFLTHSDKAVIFTNADLIGVNDEIVSQYTLLEAVELLQNIQQWNYGLDLEMMLCANRATGATMAFRQSFICEFMPLDNSGLSLHDEQISILACLQGKLGLITECLMSYRQHANNVLGVRRAWLDSGCKKSTLLIQHPNRNTRLQDWIST